MQARLGVRLGTVRIRKGNALGDQAAATGRLHRGDEIGGTLDAQAGIARERVEPPRRIKHLRQICQLMDDDVRPRLDDGIPQGAAFEYVHDDRFDATRLQFPGFGGRPRRSGHGVSSGKEERRKPPPDHTARSGQKNPHAHSPSTPVPGLRSKLRAGTSRIKGSAASAIGRKAKLAAPVKSQAAPLTTETITAYA
jgi:hypothetical protein